MELGALSNASSTSSLPDYETVAPDYSSAAGFHPTITYQIETKGHPLIALPLPPKPVPIPVYALTPSGQAAEKVYEGVAEPLLAEDVADAIAWALSRPHHVNVDLMVLRPRAQASNTVVARDR